MSDAISSGSSNSLPLRASRAVKVERVAGKQSHAETLLTMHTLEVAPQWKAEAKALQMGNSQ